ncbi:MAG: glycosyltransferase [Chitinophagaceae bacterium]|nr:MAG: glycosyltransferase [Chitinophagaceae bacterium]
MSFVILSVIIVNYNVRFFLEQNLRSVIAASAGLETEIFVIDNHSADNSLAYLQPLFPSVKFIGNTVNHGFGKACNQGLALATGKYILFLNPDTILPEDGLSKPLSFLEQQSDAGALGIRMLDGRGRFLRESKRAFPSPRTSLFKLAGLSRLFPRSPLFARYHLGHLRNDQNQQVDVLSGAYMMIRKEVLDRTGGFDESFFMYGEDIDLSYRIQLAGYKNYYFAGTSIIHFKGESTRRASANYVKMFYQAMSIFVRKHYGVSRAGFFNFSIQLAIGIRGLLSAMATFIRQIGMPAIDAVLVMCSFWIAKAVWNSSVKTGTTYDGVLLWTSFTALTLVYLAIAYYAGLYDREYQKGNLWRTATAGTVAVLALYSLLPEHYRFSRAIILLGALMAFLMMGLLRKLFVRWKLIDAGRSQSTSLALVAGSKEEYEEVVSMMAQQPQVVTSPLFMEAAGTTLRSRLEDLALSGSPDTRELIFCVGHMPVKELIIHMQEAAGRIGFRIHYHGSGSIVGSDSASKTGNSISGEARYRIGKPYFRRLKRLADVVSSLLFVILFPFHFVFVRKPLVFLQHCISVLTGKKTWIGYAGNGAGLPELQPAVIGPDGALLSAPARPGIRYSNALDAEYAEKYDPLSDLWLVFRSYRHAGD